MCFGCCTRLADGCGKLPIVPHPINHCIIGLIEGDEYLEDMRDNLEHYCVHHGELETLVYLLNDPSRIAYRKGNRSYLFYYNLLRGLCSMIIKNEFPEDVIDLFIDRLKNELIFPHYIGDNSSFGIIRSAELFEFDLQILVSRLTRHQDENRISNIEFMASFPFINANDLHNNVRWILAIPKQIIRKMYAWRARTKRRMVISLLNGELYNDLSKSITVYNF
jgi:hypothetical protein